MTSSREIRYKINSIRNTQKITRAMQMVAISKMRKAQERMLAARPYSSKILEVISHLATAHPEFRHPFLEARDIRKVGYIVVSTDRGLVGPLNVALFREIVLDLKPLKKDKIDYDLCLVGTKADAFFTRIGGNIIAKAHSGEGGSMQDLIGATKVMLDAFMEGKIDALFVASNEFVNTMTQKPFIQKLLPITSTDKDFKKRYWDYIYEPDEEKLLDTLLNRYIESLIYEKVAENFACEQASRMIAMKNATDNAGEIIDRLQLDYNKARQAAITREIAEIVGGAAAIEN